MSKQTGNVGAFLDMLAWSEGTSRVPNSDDGYRVLVGGTVFKGYADHPRILVDLGRGLKSTAAGRYQLLQRFWDYYRRFLNLKDFSPESQDAVAIRQIRERGALGAVENGRFEEAVSKCRNIWASLPGAGYGQLEHSMDKLVAAYKTAGGTLA